MKHQRKANRRIGIFCLVLLIFMVVSAQIIGRSDSYQEWLNTPIETELDENIQKAIEKAVKEAIGG